MKKISLIVISCVFIAVIHAQQAVPELLQMQNGKTVSSPEEWKKQRRPELIRLFEAHIYGKAPQKPDGMYFKTLNEDKHALNGLATRREVAVYFSKQDTVCMNILLYLPNLSKQPVPLFVGLNFEGNYTIHEDTCITMTANWVPNWGGVANNRANESKRGRLASRWPVEYLMKQGFGLATIYSGDIDPDFDDGFHNGVHGLYPFHKADDWGSIAAWAWGLSRAVDYFETQKEIDHRRVAVVGHSRLGKAALWAGAIDERFAMVVANNSGCGGASLSRRDMGESVKAINTNFPHWFCGNFKQYNDNEQALPVDQHELIALVAPRPLYLAWAESDAEVIGELQAATLANPVYSLFGFTGIPIARFPPKNTPVHTGRIGCHYRTGKHEITLYDWEQFVAFANKYMNKQNGSSVFAQTDRFRMKFSVNKYDYDYYNKLIHRYESFEDESVITTKTAEWKIETTINEQKDYTEVSVIFHLEKGDEQAANVGIQLVFDHWAKENYVLMPAAVYNGNRFPWRRIAYSPKLLDPRDIGKEVGIIITDVPRLDTGQGFSRIQERSGSMAVPSIGFYSGKQSDLFFLLTEQANQWGDYGMNIEENRTRAEAIISVCSPLVREYYKYNIVDNMDVTPDKPADFREGDRVSFRFRLYRKEASRLQDLFDFYAQIRQDVVGQPSFVPRFPFSNCFSIQEKKFNTQNFVSEWGYYSVGMRNMFLQDWQIGWTGGMISTYPLLFAGGKESEENVKRNFDWLFPNGIAPSGFFWDSGEKGNKWYGGDIRKPHTRNWHLIRKSGDGSC